MVYRFLDNPPNTGRGRLLTPGEEYLDQRFNGEVPADLDGMELTKELLDYADEWLAVHGYTFDAHGAYRR